MSEQQVSFSECSVDVNLAAGEEHKLLATFSYNKMSSRERNSRPAELESNSSGDANSNLSSNSNQPQFAKMRQQQSSANRFSSRSLFLLLIHLPIIMLVTDCFRISTLANATSNSTQVQGAAQSNQPSTKQPDHLEAQQASYSHASKQQTILLNNNHSQIQKSRDSNGRKLNLQEANQNALSSSRRIFTAEATKCLADVTEVVINTGKHFGGRISAENSLDPRCSLIGNKTSEQSRYSFKIDHQLCKSKVMDGNRIETMVLVHENKDIVTQNTGRFLVLCNFQQKSYIVKASVSLPKVNGVSAAHQGGAIKPAVIGPVASDLKSPVGGVAGANEFDSATKLVRLGSMPGIYRAKSALANTANSPPVKVLNSPSDNRSGTQMLNNGQPRSDGLLAGLWRPSVAENEVENAIDKVHSFDSGDGEEGRQLKLRQPSVLKLPSQEDAGKQLDFARVERAFRDLNNSPAANGSEQLEDGAGDRLAKAGRALTLAQPEMQESLQQLHWKQLHSDLKENRSRRLREQQLQLPKPVQVQSEALYVDATRSTFDLASRAESSEQGRGVIGADNGRDSAAASSTWPTATNSPAITGASSGPWPATLQPAPSGLARASTSSGNNNTGELAIGQRQAKLKQGAPPASGEREHERQNSADNLRAPDGADFSQAPIIMTNNHRVAGEYVSLAPTGADRQQQQPQARLEAPEAGFSIKYSAANIDEYPVEEVGVQRPAASPRPPERMLIVRTDQRSGQMQQESLDEAQHQVIVSNTSVIQRMGELQGSGRPPAANFSSPSIKPFEAPESEADFAGEASGVSADRVRASSMNLPLLPPTTTTSSTTVSPSAAQNLTSYLLRWSMRTLTNLAKKSLESLLVEPDYEPAEQTIEFETNKSAPLSKVVSQHQQVKSSKSPHQQQQPAETTTSASGQRRPADYAKSINFDRADASLSQPPAGNSSGRSSERVKAIAAQRQPAARANSHDQALVVDQQKQQQTVASSQRIDSSWLLVHCLTLLVCLMGAGFLVMWLVSASRKVTPIGRARAKSAPTAKSSNNSKRPFHNHQHPAVCCPLPADASQLEATSQYRFNESSSTASSLASSPTLIGQRGLLIRGGGNDFGHENNGLLSKANRSDSNKIKAPFLRAQAASRSPQPFINCTSSSGTGSARSTISSGLTRVMAEDCEAESNCKTNEFLYTEHVLLSPGASYSGESYA